MIHLCGAAAALLLFGCGSSSMGGSSDLAAAFAGTWTFGSGSIQPMCNITVPGIDLTGDTMTVTRVDDTHVSTELVGSGLDCTINFTVSGATATAVAGQSCSVTETVTVPTTTSVQVAIAISNWTLNVSGDTMMSAMTGTASAEAGLLTCSPTADGTATRAGAEGAI